MDSKGKAMRASLAAKQTELKKKSRERVGIPLLTERLRLGLDLWTGEPLAKTDLAKTEPKE